MTFFLLTDGYISPHLNHAWPVTALTKEGAEEKCARSRLGLKNHWQLPPWFLEAMGCHVRNSTMPRLLCYEKAQASHVKMPLGTERCPASSSSQTFGSSRGGHLHLGKNTSHPYSTLPEFLIRRTVGYGNKNNNLLSLSH